MGKESMTSPTKRRHLDVMKLMMGDYIVEASVEGSDELSDFHVDFYGPKDSPYEDGFWQVHVVLPAEYPFKSPSIGFKNRIFHPNVDFRSGTICLDVINQTWSPMFDLVNIFEVFLPQLLLYPNPADPLNSEAAAMLLEDPEMYGKKVRDLVAVHAKVPSNKENPQSSIASKSKTKSVNKTKSSENGTTNKIIGAQSSGSNNSDSDGSAPNEGSVPGTRNQNQVALLGTSLESATSLDSSFSRSLNSINMSASGPNATLIPVSLTPAEVRYASTVSAFILPKAVQIEKTSASADNVMEVDNEDSDANPEDNADDEVAFNSNCDAFDLEI